MTANLRQETEQTFSDSLPQRIILRNSKLVSVREFGHILIVTSVYLYKCVCLRLIQQERERKREVVKVTSVPNLIRYLVYFCECMYTGCNIIIVQIV